MGHHNFFDISADRSFQNGPQSRSFPVVFGETPIGADVVDELVVRVRFLEVFDLAFEVTSLVVTADSGIDDPSSGWSLDNASGGIGDGEDLVELATAVEALATGQVDHSDFRVRCPLPEYPFRDAILLLYHRGRYVLRLVYHLFLSLLSLVCLRFCWFDMIIGCYLTSFYTCSTRDLPQSSINRIVSFSDYFCFYWLLLQKKNTFVFLFMKSLSIGPLSTLCCSLNFHVSS